MRRSFGVAWAFWCLASVAFTAESPGAVTVRETPAGRYLQDARGMPLYFYARDVTPGVSTCNADCAKAWPPLAAPEGAAVSGAFAPIKREDGSYQWAHRGRPLYRYAKDRGKDAALGDRVGNAWSVALLPVQTPPGIAVRAVYAGRVLVDGRGRSLYWRDDEQPRAGHAPDAECDGDCLRRWAVLEAPLLANAVGDFRIESRGDGVRQWSFRGRRLYLSGADFRPGDVRGEGADKAWRLAVLEPAAPLPAWVTIQASDMGDIFADAKGATLYTLGTPLEKVRQTSCNDACIRKNWRLIAADASAVATGEWTLIDPPAGIAGAEVKRVWAYKGDPLYLHTRDRGPGAIAGDKWAAGAGGGTNAWFPILRRRDYEE